MNIAGVLVHAYAKRREAVRQHLSDLTGVEIHQETNDGRFVITVEDVNGSDPGDIILAIHRIEGVISAALVFHHFEDETEEAADAAA
jgi:nitrate reductase NapD